MSEVGVHRAHCCVKHGCKYGEDDCPVYNGSVTQKYPCQDCSDYPDEAVDFEPKKEDNSPMENNNAYYARELAGSLEKWAHRIENSTDPHGAGLLEPGNVIASAAGAVAELRKAADEIKRLEDALFEANEFIERGEPSE